MKLRRGDVIRFWRGSNTYTGTVVALDPLMKGCTVIPQHSVGRHDVKPWHVMTKTVVRIETPKLTAKEVVIVRLLDRYKRPMTMAEMREKGYRVNSRTLGTLYERGLIVPTREGVTSQDAPQWSLTHPDGLRAASALRA